MRLEMDHINGRQLSVFFLAYSLKTTRSINGYPLFLKSAFYKFRREKIILPQIWSSENSKVNITLAPYMHVLKFSFLKTNL